MRKAARDDPMPALLAECRSRAIALLKRNLTPAGILAATPNAAFEQARLHGHLRP